MLYFVFYAYSSALPSATTQSVFSSGADKNVQMRSNAARRLRTTSEAQMRQNFVQNTEKEPDDSPAEV